MTIDDPSPLEGKNMIFISPGFDGELAVKDWGCPFPTESGCAEFDNSADLVDHLMTAHEPWEVAAMTVRAEASLAVLQYRLRELEDALREAEVLADEHLPINRVNDLLAGLAKPGHLSE